MARVMLVIRKIVDRRAYNRANIIGLIPALTYQANRPVFPSPPPHSSATSFPLPAFASGPSAPPF